ncbi:MAG TPA: helix-turn-helix transcriptional regulator [Acidimicrobiales bacterium]|nr:helix-turn-helix transcriptional regulator [Acidimicrobiales bacterium]
MSADLRVRRTVEAAERICATTESADELLEALADTLHRAVPHDGSTWFGVDPVTMLATAPSRVEGLDPGLCDTYWHLEFHEQDIGLFSDLARGDGAVALRLSLDDRPARSIRYRDFMQPQGYDDELRSVFRTGSNTWGVVGLYREAGHPPFDESDLAVMKGISSVVADALRLHVRQASPWLGQPSAPGLVVFDRHGRVMSANADAMYWLRELWPSSPLPATTEITSLDIFTLRDRDLEVPTSLFALVARARAVADGRERTPARLRLRDQRGRWLVLHASCLSGPGSPDAGPVAVVIEAAKSAEIAPIIIEAYSLAPRERDVLSGIARGGSTAEIAAELFLSPHTVRDYVKTVFEKLGVSSRGELVARLYGEHYADRLHETMVHDD